MGLYYRYRPMSELSLKELMYDEMFFASVEESNDPYEGKVFFKFEKSQEKWKRLLEVAWTDVELASKEKYIEAFSDYLTKNSPLTFDEFQTLDFGTIKYDTTGELSIFNTVFHLIPTLKKFIDIYKPDRKYFVSFSKTPDNYLMWSHYANKHNGYCLIFRSIDGGIYQSHNSCRKVISRNTPNSFSPRMNYAIQPKFEMEEILYTDTETNIDAFLCFPGYVSGHKFKSDDERIAHCKQLQKHFLEKNSCWSYEQETRLLLHTPYAWLCGEKIEYSKHERLFHYDASQLVGIVLGYKMSKVDKQRIREIILEKIKKRYEFASGKDVRRFFDFVLFDAELSPLKRSVEIAPKEIYDGSKFLLPGDETFKKRFEEWEQGYCLEMKDKSGRKIKID